MKYAIFLVFLTGCVQSPDMLPAVAVSLELRGESAPDPPKPSETCENCGGLGYLGDTVTKRDCPECEIPWSMTLEDVVAANAAVAGSLLEIREAVGGLASKVDLVQGACPVPVVEINDAELLAEKFWEKFREDYEEEFIEKIVEGVTKKASRQKTGELRVYFDSYEEAIREATNRDCVLLLVFSSKTCEPCDRLKAAQDSLPLKGVVVCRLYVEDNPSLFQNYGIKTYPTQIVRFRSREITRVTGAMTRDYFYTWIERQKYIASNVMPN